MAMASVLSELSDLEDIQILSNGKFPGLKHITSAAMIPNKWSKFNNYVTCDNEVANLTQEIRGNKPWVLKLVVTIGSNIDIKDIVKENAIAMVQGGLLIEVKRLQVIHSKRGLRVTMLPKNTDLAYVQKHVQCCITEAVHKTIDEGSDSLMRKEFAKINGDFKILVDLAYPPSNFERQKKGMTVLAESLSE